MVSLNSVSSLLFGRLAAAATRSFHKKNHWTLIKMFKKWHNQSLEVCRNSNFQKKTLFELMEK